MNKKAKKDKVVWEAIKTTWVRSKPYRGKMLFVLIMASLQSILFPILQYVFSLIVTSLTTNTNTYLYLLVLWVFLQVTRSVVAKYRRLGNMGLGEEISQSYKFNIVKHLLNLPLNFHKNEKRGEVSDIVERAKLGIRQVNNNLFLNTLPEIFGVITTLIIAATIKPIFLIIFLVSIIIYSYTIFSLNKNAATMQRASRAQYKIANGYTEDVLSNIRSVKDFGREDLSANRMYKLYIEDGLPLWKKLWALRQNSIFIQEMILLTSRSLCLGLSIWLLLKGEINIGEIIAINYFTLRIFDPFSQLAEIWKEVENGAIALEDAENLIKEKPERETDKGLKNKIVKGDIKFNKVSFGYSDDQMILKSISFVANAGEKIAIVGESGVGKSTLIELILGYYDTYDGEISIDSHELGKLNLKHLRESVALVNQESILFNDTIRNNLLYAKENASDEELQEAATKAHITQFIEGLPSKWDTVVGERGVKLSVGQKQRVSIARAILKNPRILVLDEPTSALDAGTEKVITDMLEKEMVGRTTIVIAHRLSTVRNADKIIVMKAGEIVETGKHSDLLLIENGEYRRLYELQIGLHE